MGTCNEKYLKETASVADFLLHVRGFVILHKYLRSTMLWSYVVYVFNHLKKLNRELNKSSQHIENRAVSINTNIYVQIRTLAFKKILPFFLHWKPFKNDEDCFLFHFYFILFKFLSWLENT